MSGAVVEGTRSWIERIPKVELHLHLEGAIPLDALWELCSKYGGDPATPTFRAFLERFRYRDFPHFIAVWEWKNGFLREHEDFTFVAEAVARDLASQNIVYAEASFSPSDFARHGLETQAIATAIRAGLARVPEVEVALVADLVRDHGPERADLTLSALQEVLDQGVIGVGLGGSEQRFPAAPFAAVFERARDLGLRTTAHAGEADGAESVWSALLDLRVERIGHGTRAVEDPGLVDHLAERRLPVEACPGSNVRTGVVASVSEHPIRRFFDRGVVVTVNTDDPTMFGTSLDREYRLLVENLGFSPIEIRRLLLNAVDASWLPDPRKQDLSARVAGERRGTG